MPTVKEQQILNEVKATMRIEGMPLTPADEEAVLAVITKTKTADDILAEIIASIEANKAE